MLRLLFGDTRNVAEGAGPGVSNAEIPKRERPIVMYDQDAIPTAVWATKTLTKVINPSLGGKSAKTASQAVKERTSVASDRKKVILFGVCSSRFHSRFQTPVSQPPAPISPSVITLKDVKIIQSSPFDEGDKKRTRRREASE